MPAARKIVLDELIINSSLYYLEQGKWMSRSLPQQWATFNISHVQANEKTFCLTLRARSLFFRRRPYLLCIILFMISVIFFLNIGRLYLMKSHSYLIWKNHLKLEKSSQIMKPSFLQQTFFGHFRRWDGQKKIDFKSDICKKFRMQKNTKTNSRNRDNNTYPLMDDVHVNWINSWSFALIYFCLSS